MSIIIQYKHFIYIQETSLEKYNELNKLYYDLLYGNGKFPIATKTLDQQRCFLLETVNLLIEHKQNVLYSQNKMNDNCSGDDTEIVFVCAILYVLKTIHHVEDIQYGYSAYDIKTIKKELKHIFKVCSVCKIPSTHKCNSCGIAYYCSRNCQVKDWKKNHKAVCKTNHQKFNFFVEPTD